MVGEESKGVLIPDLARLTLAVHSCPTTSTDCERSFSGSRLSIPYLRHNLSEDKFRAGIALGSWYKKNLGRLGNSYTVS
ncbi:hypothetical protein BT69DRAFT_1158173 [Atractiella rhizophila]|nr:hypothetical protein BT69DRAFT_1158173 [Atractiella rhizophila]